MLLSDWLEVQTCCMSNHHDVVVLQSLETTAYVYKRVSMMYALVGDDVAMPQTSSDEGDEPRDDSEAALHTGSENDDDQDKDDEPRMTGEAMESMTVSLVIPFFPRMHHSFYSPPMTNIAYHLSALVQLSSFE